MLRTYVNTSALSDWRQALTGKDRDGEDPVNHFLSRMDLMLVGSPERVDLASYVGLIEEIGQTIAPSSLAWAVGHGVELPFEEKVKNAITGCKSLGTALHWFCQYFPLLQDASIQRLDVEEDFTTVTYKILDPEIWPRHEDALYTLGLCARFIKSAAPESWGQVQITVEAESSQIKADLASVVQASVVYGGGANAIRFPTSIINSPLYDVRPCNSEILKHLASDLTQKRRSTPISERTRRAIYRDLHDGNVCQEHIARELGISSRTLRRRLSTESQSFQKLLDECRMQYAALEFRTRAQLSLSDMALKLGYSEHSTFSRAFARWAGVAPQEYRRNVAAL